MKTGEMMTLQEFASALGKRIDWAVTELRRDAGTERSAKKYPFADPQYNEHTRTWSYNIYRTRFHRWLQGDYDMLMYGEELAARIADMTAKFFVEKLIK